MDLLTIGEVARRAGIATSAIRYYESLGLLPMPERVHQHRRYAPAIVDRLALIAFARQLGFSLREIGALLNDFAPETSPAERWNALAPQKIAEIDTLIARAQQVKMLLEQTQRCACASLDACAGGDDAKPLC